MDQNDTHPPPPNTIHCFLSPPAEHQRLRLVLNTSVVLQPTNVAAPLPHELIQLLVTRYGGAPENWHIRRVYTAFLIAIPDWVFGDDFYLDEAFWETHHLAVHPWQTLDGSAASPLAQRVTIKVTDFPLDYWHPVYFRQATSSLGTLLGMAPEAIEGNMATIRLLIATHDLSLIPPTITLHHNNRTSICPVFLEGNPDRAPPPPPGLPPPGPPLAQVGPDWHTQGMNNDPNYPLRPPYLPPWRRQALHRQVQNPDPARQGAPAAAFTLLNHRSTSYNYVPSPQNLKGRFQKYSPLSGSQSPGDTCTGKNKIQDACALLPSAGSHEPIGLSNGSHTTGSCSVTRENKNHSAYPWVTLPHVKSSLESAITATPLMTKPQPVSGITPAQVTCNSVSKEGNACPFRIGYSTQHKGAQPTPCTSDTDTCRFSHASQLQNKKPPYYHTPHNHLIYKCCHPRYDYHVPLPQENKIQSAATTKTPVQLKYKNSTITPFLHPFTKTLKMASLTVDDEALIAKFIGLQTDDELAPTVTLPQHATTSVDWGSSILAKIVTDRMVLDVPFAKAMIQAWNAHPGTLFSSVSKNCFLIEFQTDRDRHTASRGIWTYRGDLVALKQVEGQGDLTPDHITHAPLLVQLFNLPVNCVKEEGFQIIANKVGRMISPPVEGYVGGRRFVKMKVLIDLNQPMKDRVRVKFPALGEFIAYCVYEKINRICSFCGSLGHDFATCHDHERLTEIMHRSPEADEATKANLLAPKRGSWMTNASLVPLPTTPAAEQHGNNKRRLSMDYPNGTGNELGPTCSHPSTDQSFVLSTISAMDASPPLLNKRLRPAGHTAPASEL